MPTEIDTVITRFEADASQEVRELERLRDAQKELDKAQRSADEGQKDSEKARKRQRDSTKDVTKEVFSLGNAMRAFAAGQRQEARAARYFIDEFTPFLPAGSKARDLLGALTTGLVGGGGFGFALEAVTLGIRWFTDALEEDRRKLEEIDRQIEKTITTAQERVAALRQDIVRLKGGETAVAMDVFRRDLKRVNEELRKEHERSEELWGKGTLNRTERYTELTAERDKLVKAMKEEIGLIREREGLRAAEQDAKARERDATRGAKEDAKAYRDAEAALGAYMTAYREALEAQSQPGAQIDFAGAQGFEFVETPRWIDFEAEEELERLDAIMTETRSNMRGLGKDAVRYLAGDVAGALGSVVRGSAAYERAMEAQGEAAAASADLSAAAFAAFTQNALASVAERAAVEAVFETAMGLAALARSFWDPTAGKEAGLHFAAAAEFGGVAAIAGVGAYAIKNTRGMMREERAAVDAAGQDQEESAGGSSGGGTLGAGGSSQETLTVREKTIVFIPYDPLSTPAEEARRWARAKKIAERADMDERTAG